jgi:hydroxymethylglutaryl-CoA synthase
VTTELRPVGIAGVGVAVPSLRLTAAEVGRTWGTGGGRATLAVCDADEDTLTLAWQAAERALEAAGKTPDQVSGLWWGTTRPPFAEGPSHPFLAAALGLSADVAGGLAAGSPHAGMEALVAAWDALAAGHATAGETATGAGAAALVLTAFSPSGSNGSSSPARLVGRATRAMPAVDRVRGDGETGTGDVYDARLFREEVYLPLLAEVGAALGGPPDRWSLADPDGKLAAAAGRRLGGSLVSGDVRAALGDTGAAAGLLGGAAALDTPGSLGIVGYGGGRVTAVTVEVHRSVPGAAAVAGQLAGGEPTSYTHVLRARGQLEAQTDPIPMGVPPGGAAFVRGNVEMLSLEGARCAACGTVSTPPSVHPHCIACGGADLEVISLVRRGTIQTFVVNQTMPPPFQAPLPIVVVDLEDGARLMVQGVSADAPAMAVGDQVVLTLRRYALERGIPVYGYKALREVPSAESGDPSGGPATRVQEVAK